MRRPVGMLLVGLGAFCLALAPMVRFYVAGKVIIAPRSIYMKTSLEAKNASYFDSAQLKVRKGASLLATNTVRADTRAGSDNVAVWDSSTVIRDTDRDKQVDLQEFRVALDRHTSQLINCCGVKVGDDTNVKMSGYGVIFPVGHVEKQDYSFFDMTTKQPWPMRYDGEERVQGITTYRFVQDIASTKIAHVGKLSGSLFDLGKKSGLVDADRYYSARITYWADPRTGIPVKQDEQIRNVVKTTDGTAKLEAGSAELVTLDSDQKSLVRLSSSTATKIQITRVIVPAGGLILGLLFTVVGGAVAMIGGGGQRDRREAGSGPSGGGTSTRTPSGRPAPGDRRSSQRSQDSRTPSSSGSPRRPTPAGRAGAAAGRSGSGRSDSGRSDSRGSNPDGSDSAGRSDSVVRAGSRRTPASGASRTPASGSTRGGAARTGRPDEGRSNPGGSGRSGAGGSGRSGTGGSGRTGTDGPGGSDDSASRTAAGSGGRTAQPSRSGARQGSRPTPQGRPGARLPRS